MVRCTHTSDDFGAEIQAPAGYYQPQEQGFIEYEGRRVAYTLGIACIESSCCGVGSWNYLRVEGYLTEGSASRRVPLNAGDAGRSIGIDGIEDPRERAAIAAVLAEKHPGARIEFG